MEIIDPYSRPEKNQIMLKRGFWALLATAVFLVLWALFLPADWEERFGMLAAPIRWGASLPITQSLAEAATLPKSVITGVLGLLPWLVLFFGLYCLRWAGVAHSPTGELRLVNTDQEMSPLLWVLFGVLLWPVVAFCCLSFPWWMTKTPERWRTVSKGTGALMDEMIIAMLDDRLWLGVWSSLLGLFIGSLIVMSILYFPVMTWANLTGRKALTEDELTPEERRLRRQRMVKESDQGSGKKS